jgi:hypothetical protein
MDTTENTVKRSAVRRFKDKLYGGLNMSWPKVILLYAGDIQ